MDAGLAARSLSALAADGRADLGSRPLSKIDFNDIYYYSAPKGSAGPTSLAEVDPELLRTYERLGIPLKEQEILSGVRRQDDKSSLDGEDGVYSAGNVAVDAIFDSVSVVTTFKHELAKAGVIFCSISEALREHPDLVRKYLGSVVPQGDNFYAALNSAVFSDGSFVYVPPNTRCPMELSTCSASMSATPASSSAP